ncbi:MAG: holo-ACP synthase [Alphaproteobacteria bacterium]
MIYGIGTDIVNIQRIEDSIAKFGVSFLTKIFTENERADAEKKANPNASYAKKFAAKEALSKALGTGIGKTAGWQDIELSHTDAGQPQVILHGTAHTALQAKIPHDTNYKIDISLSDEPPYAQAFAVISLESKK